MDQDSASLKIGDDTFELLLEKPFQDQIDDLNKKFINLTESSKEAITSLLERDYNENVRRANLSSGRLSIFNSQKGNLYEVWNGAFVKEKKWLRDSLFRAYIKEELSSIYSEYTQLLRRHRDYDSKNFPVELEGSAVADVIDEYRSKITGITGTW